MGEEKANLQNLAQKVDELLNVLNVIAKDLSDVSKSLKSATTGTTSPSTPVSTTVTPNSVEKRDINDVKQAFSPELAGMLLFDQSGKYIIVKPRRFLGSDNFAKIASVVREIGGEYVSSGRNSHFKIAKK